MSQASPVSERTDATVCGWVGVRLLRRHRWPRLRTGGWATRGRDPRRYGGHVPVRTGPPGDLVQVDIPEIGKIPGGGS